MISAKVDLLFAVDNSESMAPKHALFSKSAAEFVRRLVTPDCIGDDGAVLGPSIMVGASQPACFTGRLEFPAVEDLHVALITSSLGGAGGDRCSTSELVGPGKSIPAVLNRHQDDRAELVNRQGRTEESVPFMTPENFLAWLPGTPTGVPSPSVLVPDASTLATNVAAMIDGVHDYGCGYEAQLESVYRFLVQPDPYGRIEIENSRSQVTVRPPPS